METSRPRCTVSQILYRYFSLHANLDEGTFNGIGGQTKWYHIVVIIINPLTVRVVGALQMILQPVVSLMIPTELKGSPFKAWSRSVYCHACYAYCQGFLPCSSPFTCISFKSSPEDFLC